MIKILANDGIHPDGKMLLEEANYQVDTEKVAQEDLPEVLPQYDGLIVRSATKVRKALIDQCPNLKIIARAGVGMDNIDVEYARSKGIIVMNTPSASSQSVAELVFAHMLSLSRFLQQANRDMPQKGGTEFKKLKKSYSKGTELFGKTIGIVGFGRIGQNVARIALGMGMRVLPVDLVQSELQIEVNTVQVENAALSITVQTVEWEEMLAESDYITFHVPFQGGKALMDEEAFAKAKDGVRLINTARGGVIDEEALLKALESGKVGGAGLDVFENEPTPRAELLNHPLISVTPHTGASTVEAQNNIGLEIADAFIKFFENQ